MNTTSTRSIVIARVSLSFAAAAAAATVLGACSASPGHSAGTTIAPSRSAARNIFTAHSTPDTGKIVLTAATAAQSSEQAVQAFSNSLPDTPLFNAFKQGLFNATHNPLG